VNNTLSAVAQTDQAAKRMNIEVNHKTDDCEVMKRQNEGSMT